LRESNLLAIALAHEQPLFRRSLKELLISLENFEVVINVDNGLSLLEQLEEDTADIVLLDVHMPRLDGYDTLREIKKKFPDQKVIALTNCDDDYAANRMLKLGVNGYLAKNCSSEELVSALFHVFTSGMYTVNLKPGQLHRALYDPAYVAPEITKTDKQLLHCFSTGLTDTEIASKLKLKKDYIVSLKVKLFEKLSVHSKEEAVSFGFRNGFLPFTA
jgi:DNA-binding NarL/FixJ family response regulator